MPTKFDLYDQIVKECDERKAHHVTCRAWMISRFLDKKVSSADLGDEELAVYSMFKHRWEGAK